MEAAVIGIPSQEETSDAFSSGDGKMELELELNLGRSFLMEVERVLRQSCGRRETAVPSLRAAYISRSEVVGAVGTGPHGSHGSLCS